MGKLFDLLGLAAAAVILGAAAAFFGPDDDRFDWSPEDDAAYEEACTG